MRGRGLKRLKANRSKFVSLSPSMRGRGLKRIRWNIHGPGNKSPSMRGRGLKHVEKQAILLQVPVALHAGAWIETIFTTFFVAW